MACLTEMTNGQYWFCLCKLITRKLIYLAPPIFPQWKIRKLQDYANYAALLKKKSPPQLQQRRQSMPQARGSFY